MDNAAHPLPLAPHWPQIKATVARGNRSTGHCAIASISPEGRPNVTPVGTVFLRDDQTGFYFDVYTSALARNIDANPEICLMAVDSGSWMWFRSLVSARFAAPPGVRLYGTAGNLRAATAEEREAAERRVRVAQVLKGGRALWSNFTHVRDLTFDSFRPVRYPTMMDGMWSAG
ncbi:pyridoxamine 5'-phosphate oxidase family protein [Nocardia jejuensis]|uniref:pyridoxamine 5'-phosphate oxidase family protein n=1 Tax=Nocardia jejuensis TaxID=328049 RepID=UPI000A067B96|nr:pyridoxamine 5'-phosphate oxidase family protein [Nocardia jejuensis]